MWELDLLRGGGVTRSERFDVAIGWARPRLCGGLHLWCAGQFSLLWCAGGGSCWRH